MDNDNMETDDNASLGLMKNIERIYSGSTGIIGNLKTAVEKLMPYFGRPFLDFLNSKTEEGLSIAEVNRALAKKHEAEACLLNKKAARLAESIMREPSSYEILERIALENLVSDLTKKKYNLERVVGMMFDELPSFARPSGDVKAISAPWLEQFRYLAERPSDADLQVHFARILAGEIANPGSFDPATLTILTILTQDAAEFFQLLCCMSILTRNCAYILISVPDYEKPTTAHNSISGLITMGEQLSPFGLSHSALLELRTMGLLASLPEEQYPDFGADFDGRALPFAGRAIRLDASGHKQKHGEELRCNALSLTSAGNQLRSILSLEPRADYTAALSTMMKRARINMKLVH